MQLAQSKSSRLFLEPPRIKEAFELPSHRMGRVERSFPLIFLCFFRRQENFIVHKRASDIFDVFSYHSTRYLGISFGSGRIELKNLKNAQKCIFQLWTTKFSNRNPHKFHQNLLRRWSTWPRGKRSLTTQRSLCTITPFNYFSNWIIINKDITCCKRTKIIKKTHRANKSNLDRSMEEL